MNPNFLKVIEQLILKGIRVEIYSEQGKTFAEIQIGSKTGTGRLSCDGDSVILETRYNQKDAINPATAVEDISVIAWGWFLNYQTRGYGPSLTWLPIWKEQGLITEETKTITEYKIL
jgi:hypothetical protein